MKAFCVTEPPGAPDQPTDTPVARPVDSRTRVRWVDGVRWIVREAEPPAFDRRAGPSLIFESDEIVRRMRDYPADWFVLSGEQLYRISLGKLASEP